MQNESQNAPEVTATKQEYRLEFIPLPLAYMQIDRHAQVGKITFEALAVLHKALADINPAHEALVTARVTMAKGLPILSELMKGEDMINEARKRTNKALYGTEEIYSQEEAQNAEPAA